jgi:hypothetical protein
MPIARRCFALLFALLAALPAPAVSRSLSQPELDRMLAPIALYPDPLLLQVLTASRSPLDVIQAARWSRANPGLPGEDAVRAAERESWDPSVKALLAFPQLLQRMEENPDWVRALGEAFVVQEPSVMETVQQLRQRAAAAGNLQSDAQIHVERQGQDIVVQPAAPAVVYVPYYDPLVVYGPWWWPAYRPVAWAPWPGYARPYRAAGLWWGPPVIVHRTVTVERQRWRPQPPRAQPVPQVSQARQAPAPAAAAPRMRYHPPSFERQGAQGWTRSQSSPAPAAGSARPPRSRF